VSQLQPDERIPDDPLLDFSTEPATADAPPTPPEVSQPVEATPVRSELDDLRDRVVQLESALDRSTKQLGTLRSEFATLVGAQKDIRAAKIVPKEVKADRSLRLISAIAGIVIGVAASAWFWINTSSETPVIHAPVAAAAAPLPEVAAPAPAAPPPEVHAAIIPAAAVTPVHESAVTPAHESPSSRQPRPEPIARPITYVGTLTIDSDPAGNVSIDGKPAGRTPVRAENLKAGSHLIWIERDGYRRFTRVVQVPSDRITRMTADLEPTSR